MADEGNSIDRTILRYCDVRSPEEIAEMLGGIVSANEIAARTQVLLASPDWLTGAQEDRAITLRLYDLLHEIEDRSQDDKMFTLRLKALDKLGDRLEKRHQATQAEIETWDKETGKKVGRIIDRAMDYMKGALREKVDPELWDELLVEAIREAQRAESVKEVTP